MTLVRIDQLSVTRSPTFRLVVPKLELSAGEVVGLVGNNGAGKSTLLDVSAGLLPYDGGQVRVLDLDPNVAGHEVRKDLAWMTDDMTMFPGSIEKNLRLFRPFYPKIDEQHWRKLATHFDVDPKAPLKTLSKGNATRARLVITFALQTRIVLLDEPTTGLDAPARAALLKQIAEVMRDEERLVVFSSHDFESIERICDRLVVLDRGKLAADTTPQQFARAATLRETLAAGVSS
jgi:ABC-2 type transport system ATP-binding protein